MTPTHPTNPDREPLISETIFDGKYDVIPLMDVSHIQKTYDKDGKISNIYIITKHSTWNSEQDCYNNWISLHGEEAQKFLKDWCRFRYEYEKILLHQK